MSFRNLRASKKRKREDKHLTPKVNLRRRMERRQGTRLTLGSTFLFPFSISFLFCWKASLMAFQETRKEKTKGKKGTNDLKVETVFLLIKESTLRS